MWEYEYRFKLVDSQKELDILLLHSSSRIKHLASIDLSFDNVNETISLASYPICYNSFIYYLVIYCFIYFDLGKSEIQVYC